LNAELQIEIKNQVEDQVRAEVKNQVRIQALQNEAYSFQSVVHIDTYIEKIQQWTLDNKSSTKLEIKDAADGVENKNNEVSSVKKLHCSYTVEHKQ
jgi:hypothetical protein